jgi:hypothetical protein
MLDDQQLRRQLIHYADGVGVDAEADLARVRYAASSRAGRGRRIALLTVVPWSSPWSSRGCSSREARSALARPAARRPR